MYQFVFSKMDVSLPFNLNVSRPHCRLVLPSMANTSICRMNNTLIFVLLKESDEGEIKTQLENLEDPIVIVSTYV